MSDKPLLLGLDAGGSTTVVLGRCQDVVARHVGPGTNLKRDGLHACAERLMGVVHDIMGQLPPGDALFACVGLAGAGRPEERRDVGQALRERLRARIRIGKVEILHDGELTIESALPEGRSGLVCIAGTGSIVLARTDAGELLRAGGWGRHIDGDPGSGLGIGRAALAAVAGDFDGGEKTLLRLRLAERLDVREPEDLMRVVYDDEVDPPTLAPLVIDTAIAGDSAAARILQEQVSALTQRAAWLAARAVRGGTIERQAVFFGGMLNADHYRELLTGAFRVQLPGWHILEPRSAPEEAALARAARRATSGRFADS